MDHLTPLKHLKYLSGTPLSRTEEVTKLRILDTQEIHLSKEVAKLRILDTQERSIYLRNLYVLKFSE